MTDQPCGPIDWARRQQAEREIRQTTSPAATQATEPAPWSQLEAHAFNAVQPALRESGEWLRLSSRRAVARAVLAAVQPHFDPELRRQLDDAIAALGKSEAELAELRAHHANLRRYRDWLADQHARTVRADQAGGVPDDLKISPHNGIATGLHTALLGLDRILAAHDTGPSIRECAEADARWWNGEKAGE